MIPPPPPTGPVVAARSIPRSLIWLLLGGELLLFAVAGLLSYSLMAETRASQAWVKHSHEVLETFSDLRLSATRLTAWTLYFVHGDGTITAATLRTEIERLPALLAALRGLVADDPLQVALLDEIATPFHERLDIHRRLIEAVKPGDVAAATSLIVALGQNADPLRLKLADFGKTEQVKLAARNLASERTQRRIVVLLIAVYAAAFVLGLLATLQFLHRLRLQRARALELEAANAEIVRQSEAVQAGTRRLDAVLDNARDVIMLITRDLRIASANQACSALLGAPPEQVIGRRVTEILPDFEAVDGNIWRRQAHRADGAGFAAEVSVGSCELDDGPAYVCVMRDVTERQRLEQVKDDFVSTVSHELRTPLTAVRGSLALVASGAAGNLPVKARGLIDVAHKNSQRLVEVVNDLLDLQKLDEPKVSLRRDRVDVRRLVGAAVDASQEFARQYKVETLIDDQSAVKPRVVGDFARLQQVLTNLLSNAIKFSPPGARVTVTIQTDATDVTVAVRDHGPGIPESFRPRLYERFAQADTGDARRARGTGLGLTLVKAIVDHHGGVIDVESPLPDGGTRFWIRLALRTVATSTASKPRRAEPRGSAAVS